LQAIYFYWLQPPEPEQGHMYVHFGEHEPQDMLLPGSTASVQQDGRGTGGATARAGEKGGNGAQGQVEVEAQQRLLGNGGAASGDRISFWEGFCR
jgi:hypothetical protein